jgi:queuine/archaeosine tRNA-ribosyltransferase
MADICVIFASEDEAVVRKLVHLLRNHWDVWWAGDIGQGNWEKAVRLEIPKAKAVVPVFSRYTEEKDIFIDELRYAKKQGRLIFPFFIDQADPPFGFGQLNRTESFGWKGEHNNLGYRQLREKIAAKLKETRQGDKNLIRMATFELGGKTLQLPCFLFSVSSHETQIQPRDGVKLFQLLQPSAVLISAYDAWKYREDDKDFLSNVHELRKSNCAVFLDSGNYEAYRKKDQYSNRNEDGWRSEYFRRMASEVSPDFAFAFDETDPEGGIGEVTERIISNFHGDENAIRPRDFPLCPIVHLPVRYEGLRAECASQIVSRVVSALDPIMVAIPERELGDGLIERVRTVLHLRRALNDLGRYYPLHLLGAGNPISMVAFAIAGADCFDGLEWCRTVADYDNGSLFHFQHFDCFRERYLTRLRSQEIRRIVEDSEASYGARVASYNLDFFTDWTRTIQDMIRAEQVEYLLKTVPNIGTRLFKELAR